MEGQLSPAGDKRPRRSPEAAARHRPDFYRGDVREQDADDPETKIR
jgi:hypothetical protein